jgi:DAPG hydrolase PhiG domain
MAAAHSPEIELTRYRLPIAEMPAAARAAHARGVVRGEIAGIERAAVTLQAEYQDGVRRAPDGTALVLCTTQMPGVTPAMIDWWFGWHLPETARYKLWHPNAHLKAVAKEDRSALADDRARYVGNASHVDEYIGRAISRLSIEFQPAASFGFTNLDRLGATAICARTVDRRTASEGGSLVHLVLPTARGCEMRSAFFLGRIASRIPLLSPLVNLVANTPLVRRLAITDRFLLDLFQHCSEEMNHLAKFLPALYADTHPRIVQPSVNA